MAETVQASQQDGHFNESIVNEEILEDMKKNRIDHMKYLPDMEQLEESDVMDQVISAMNAYDYDKYTEADVRRALVHEDVYKRQCKYYVVCCPKYRRKVLINGVDVRLKELLTEYAANLSVDILEMEIMPDPVSYTHLDVYKRQLLFWDASS